jgi:hypothetical protein
LAIKNPGEMPGPFMPFGGIFLLDLLTQGENY